MEEDIKKSTPLEISVDLDEVKAVKDAIQYIKNYRENDYYVDILDEIDRLLDLNECDFIEEVKIIKCHAYEMAVWYFENYTRYDYNYFSDIHKINTYHDADSFHMGMNYIGFLYFVDNENWNRECFFSDERYDDITEHIVDLMDSHILNKWLARSRNSFIDDFNSNYGLQFRLNWGIDKYDRDWNDDENGYIRISIFYGNNHDDFLAYANGVKIKEYINGQMKGSVRMFDSEYKWTLSNENGEWIIAVIDLIGKVVEEKIKNVCKQFDYDNYVIWNIINVLYEEVNYYDSIYENTTISAKDLLDSLHINKDLIRDWSIVVKKVCDIEYGHYLLYYSKSKDAFVATINYNS